MPRRWEQRLYSFQVFPIKIAVLVATHSQPSYIQRISAQLPMLFFIDLIYAYFLEINRESKEKIFNSYWENKKLNGYRRQKRVRKS
ncbi:phosphosugar-binding transcriptional regulator [Streptococcus pneumoniae]|nr:phosphosugar-binding transcriptional regulator [Streptococcus pneumoniae]